ncbi:transcriptional regulator, TetR family [Devosia sp. YR412]|uniref:TetR/AcrR family transcriptional regulator n=1 Tax=Devosia sp. YR412 TaxID=1881030 RepID=UPI0008BEBA1B|nr:TetR family transcriptional regulator [Devosia sp. YR412]SEP96819.1 transcriptional regulator, TetR family [Devosia sp. YR412]
MGRTRVIDQQQVLDAAERVVARDGAARLTLDAVAVEAGISKASVLYDFKSKQALVAALVNRSVAADNAFNAQMTERLDGAPNATIRGRLLAAAKPFPDDFRAVALNLCAALAQDAALRQTIQRNQAEVIETIATSSANPRGAMLAYLALEGLKLLESLDYHRWPRAERDRIIREINWLIDAAPRDDLPLPDPA